MMDWMDWLWNFLNRDKSTKTKYRAIKFGQIDALTVSLEYT